MDSDPIENTPNKRRKIDYSSGAKVVTLYGNDGQTRSGLGDYDTIPTQPLSQVGRLIPQPTMYASFGAGIFSSTLAAINNTTPPRSSFHTQPTQPLDRSPNSPVCVVPPSSPPPENSNVPRPPQPSFSTRMAPPGTSFKRPGSGQIASQNSVDLTFDDPPIDRSSDDEEDVNAQKGIKSTTFHRGGQDNQTDRLNFSKYAYDPQRSHTARPLTAQMVGSRAQPAAVEMTLADITDAQDRDKVMRMKSVAINSTITELYSALKIKKGDYTDAIEYVLGQKEASIDLLSDGDNDASAQTTKQAVRATKNIREKYSSHKSPVKPTPAAVDITSSPPPVRTKGRLQRGRRQPSPEEEEEKILSRDLEDDDSDSDTGTKYVKDDIQSESEIRLLAWFNECSNRDLADLANEKLEIADLILSQRPFTSLDIICTISEPTLTTTKSNRKVQKRPIGDRIVDVCQEMWEGYEAIDKLVDSCQKLGEPIFEMMRKWGLDTDVASKSGELEMTSLNEVHDSGIGTPASNVSIDGDGSVSNRKSTALYLKQPSIMSEDLVMKDYQVFGLNWLNLLWTKQLSCILADDMGLGKTCQVISFLSHLKEVETKGTHLVIVPGSTLENWMREFRRFSPSLRVEAYYGPQALRAQYRAEIEGELDSVDVVVTTYDTAVNQKEDNKFLRKIVRPRVCVFDEGHQLKNANSKRHKELMNIPADFRLLLTGTPLQNNLQELASLLGFILPNLFQEDADKLDRIFKYKATTKDASHAALLSAERINRARAMMAPFILRRKKAQVLKDLPAKTRRVQSCDMVNAQRKLWSELVAEAQADRENAAVVTATNEVPASRGRKSANVSSAKPSAVHMTSLRFCALHPLLLRRIYTDAKLKKLQDILLRHPKSEFLENASRPDLMWKYLTEDLKGGDFALHKFCLDRADYIPKSFQLVNEEWMTLSGKIPALKNLLQEWISHGSRALIFSAFTTMLDILEAVLTTLSIPFCRLDGSTPMADRQELIDVFTNDENIKVFMLSTKAGGAGINLASADKVVILETGFNPQDEIQAENRAHRVGQKRDVEVVRLVTKGTIEELILALGESKLALDEKVYSGADATTTKTSTVDSEEKEGEKKIEDMFLEKIEEFKVSNDPEAGEEGVEHPKLDKDMDLDATEVAIDGDVTDVNTTEVVEDKDEEEEPIAKRPTKKGRAVAKTPASKKQKQKETKNSDIKDMFRKGLRQKGLQVGE